MVWRPNLSTYILLLCIWDLKLSDLNHQSVCLSEYDIFPENDHNNNTIHQSSPLLTFFEEEPTYFGLRPRKSVQMQPELKNDGLTHGSR